MTSRRFVLHRLLPVPACPSSLCSSASTAPPPTFNALLCASVSPALPSLSQCQTEDEEEALYKDDNMQKKVKTCVQMQDSCLPLQGVSLLGQGSSAGFLPFRLKGVFLSVNTGS